MNEELRSYVEQALNSGQLEGDIRKTLLEQGGWNNADLNAVFATFSKKPEAPKPAARPQAVRPATPSPQTQNRTSTPATPNPLASAGASASPNLRTTPATNLFPQTARVEPKPATPNVANNIAPLSNVKVEPKAVDSAPNTSVGNMKKSGGSKGRIFVGLILLVILLALGFWFWVNFKSDSDELVNLSDSVTEEPEGSEVENSENEILDSVDVVTEITDELESCFFSERALNELVSTDGWTEFEGFGFELSYPASDVQFVESENLEFNEFNERTRTYTISLNNDSRHKALIVMTPLTENQAIFNSSYDSVTYERFSDTWWVGAPKAHLRSSMPKQCQPAIIAETELDGYPIYTTQGKSGFINHILVRETLDVNKEPLKLTIWVTGTGIGQLDQENEEFRNNEEQLKDIIHTMIRTFKLIPTSKG